MAQFLSQISTDLASMLVYIAILALFVICMVKCVAPVAHSRNLLRRAVRRIKQGDQSRYNWQDETFLGKGALYPHWKEYLNNLFFADGRFHNPSNVEDFINEDTAIYGPGRAPFAEAAPGVMVSLGFLGTLLGMTQGLSGFNMQDSEAVMGTIRQLVPGVRYAFTTSIVGVVASIVATLTIRVVHGAALRSLNSFYSAMKEYAGVASVDPMTQIAIYQQEQTALITRMSESLTDNLAERMSQGIARSIDKSYQGLQTSLDNFMNFSTQSQTQAVEDMADRFMDRLNQHMEGQFERLARTLEETGRNQTQMNEYVRQSAQGLNQVSGNMVQAVQLSGAFVSKLDEYLTRLNANAAQAQEGYDRLNANAEHLQAVARQFNTYLQGVNKAQSEITSALDRFEEASAAFMDCFTQSARSSAQSLDESALSLKQTGDVLAANHKALVGGISRDIDQTYNNFFRSTNEMIEQIGWMAEDMKKNLETLPQVIAEAGAMYADQAQMLKKCLEDIRQLLEGAAPSAGQDEHR